MADSNKYRFTAGQWTASSGGCGCGGAKKPAVVAANVNNDLVLVWAQVTPQLVAGTVYSYNMQPHTGVLDLDPQDYAVFATDPRFRKPTVAELAGIFGMNLKHG